MKRNLIIAACVLSLSTSFIVAGAVYTKNNGGVVQADDVCLEHAGNHYNYKAPTNSTPGHKEFWACCKCGEVFLEKPETGTFIDRDEEYMTGGISSSHAAYLGPLDTHLINFFASSYTLSPEDKATLILDETAERMTDMGALTYRASNSLVSVSNNGIITAGNVLGNSEILVTSQYGGYSTTIDVSVTDAARNGGFITSSIDEVFEYPYVIRNRYDLNLAMCETVVQNYIYAEFNLDLGSNSIDANAFADLYDLTGYSWRYIFYDDIYSQNGNVLSTLEGNRTVYLLIVCNTYNDDYVVAENTCEPLYETTQLTNAMAAIRHAEIQASSNKRSDTFLDFPFIVNNTKGYADVYNSEQLWWSILHGYIPRFPLQHSRAEEIYERAKDALRKEITDDMSDAEKFLAIYDWISDNNRYDTEVLDIQDNWIGYTSYYLEGPWLVHRSVCDAFSKSFCMLAAMEGLTVERGSGFNDGGGHAWNYANVDGQWYTICTTWAQADFEVEAYWDSYFSAYQPKPTTPYFDFTTYNTFMADIRYMQDESGYDLDVAEYVREGYTTSHTISVFDVANYDGGESDYKFETLASLNRFFEKCYEIGLENFYLPYDNNASNYLSNTNIAKAISLAGFNDYQFSGCSLGSTGYLVFSLQK